MKKILLVALMTIMALSSFAQRITYSVIAKVPYNAQKEEYGKLEPLNMNIIRQGDTFIYIGATRYDITAVNSQKKEAKEEYKEYSAIDSDGKEYTIKVANDGNAVKDVMRYYVLLFNNNDIYNWTYYFTDPGTEVKD